MTNFKLHTKLAEDCFQLGNFQLSQLLMMNDSQYPWFILVPRRVDITEIHQLNREEQIQLLEESSYFSSIIQNIFDAKKMNIAALGNMVPQLHLHIIARFERDTAWPNPVWGHQKALPFNKIQLLERIDILHKTLDQQSFCTFHWDEQWT